MTGTRHYTEVVVDELTEKLEEIKKLNRRRFDYVMAKSDMEDVKAACEKIGVSRQWYYNFSDEERAYMDRLAEELHYAHVIKAKYALHELLGDAVIVIKESIDGRDKRIKLEAAKYALDTAGVKAPTKTEVKQSGDVTIRVIYDDDQDTNAR